MVNGHNLKVKRRYTKCIPFYVCVCVCGFFYSLAFLTCNKKRCILLKLPIKSCDEKKPIRTFSHDRIDESTHMFSQIKC